MDWPQLLCQERFGGEKILSQAADVRTPFDSDIDRITFCGGFRRLARKTQVHPLAANDHVHNRLTHSLEVARVGRSLGKAIGKEIKAKGQIPDGVEPGDVGTIVQAACLAHDLGNPAFGHAGEEAISQWFQSDKGEYLADLDELYKRDIRSFDGNAQGFRMLTQTENFLYDGGLRLTYATLATFMKYPWSTRTITYGDKFGVFLTEENVLDDIANKVGLVARGEHRWCRHPLAYLVEAADDICYSTIDLEDAVEIGALQYKTAEELLLNVFSDEQRKAIKGQLRGPDAHRVNFMRMRGPVFAELIGGAIDAFVRRYDTIMAGEMKVEELFAVLGENDVRGRIVSEGKKIGNEVIYKQRRKVELELGCFAIMDCLLEAYCLAAHECFRSMPKEQKDRARVSWKARSIMNLLKNHVPRADNLLKGESVWTEHLCFRRMIDYLSGMTDNYASYIAGQLRGCVSISIR